MRRRLKRDPSLRATLELSGITGLRYIEIDRRSGDALHQAPTLTFKPPYEVIPSSRSSFKAIQTALGDIYDQFMRLDLPAISKDTRDVLKSANQLFQDERIDAVLSNLKSITSSTSGLAKNLESMTAGVKLAPAVDNATQATAQAKDLFTNLTSGPTGQQFGEAVVQVNRLAQSAQQVVVQLQYTIERLQRTLANVESLTDEIKNQPSLLLFSEPPRVEAPAEATQ
jgi:ABC-type transporter Mla subunit MlaD